MEPVGGSGRPRVAVVGATGFVGSAVVGALTAAGVEVKPVTAPRLKARTLGSPDVDWFTPGDQADLEYIKRALCGINVVINCAGDPDASSRDVASLTAANAVLPALLARAAAEAAVTRLVHVSSAVVQGRRSKLDQTFSYDAFSLYAYSKALGEMLLTKCGPKNTVIYRPPSVHAEDRRVTRLTAKLARSPFSSVAFPGDAPTPQAHISNVGAAVAFLALATAPPPVVVIHPSEGLTTRDFLRALGDRDPRMVPEHLARMLTFVLNRAGRLVPALDPYARRIEMVWWGQGQGRSWLDDQGWVPPTPTGAWSELGERLAAQRTNRERTR